MLAPSGRVQSIGTCTVAHSNFPHRCQSSSWS